MYDWNWFMKNVIFFIFIFLWCYEFLVMILNYDILKIVKFILIVIRWKKNIFIELIWGIIDSKINIFWGFFFIRLIVCFNFV